MTTAARELFDDLLSLEVNIIVKPGMTARKMPDVAHALLDIFSDFDTWLCSLTAGLNGAWSNFRATEQAVAFANSAAPGDWLVVDGALINGLEAVPIYDENSRIAADDFGKLRARARKGEEMYRLLVHHGHLSDDGSAIILKRIYRNCDQIKGILDGRGVSRGTSNEKLRKVATEGLSRKDADAGDVPLTADEILVVRKVWEVGTETIAMQTVAQLDGDVITRVQHARLAATNKPLHDLHREAVGTALAHWQFLVGTLVQLTTKAADFLTR